MESPKMSKISESEQKPQSKLSQMHEPPQITRICTAQILAYNGSNKTHFLSTKNSTQLKPSGKRMPKEAELEGGTINNSAQKKLCLTDELSSTNFGDIKSLELPVTTDSAMTPSCSMEKSIVDSSLKNLWSLPEVVSQVHIDSRTHNQELSAQRELLESLKGILATEQELINDVQQELQEHHRKVVSSQNMRSNMKMFHQKLCNEIEKLIDSNIDLESLINEKKNELDEFKITELEYERKMSCYSASVDYVERDVDGNADRSALQAELSSLQTKMEKGVYEKEMGPIKIEVKNIEDELLDIDGNLHQIQGEINSSSRQLENAQRDTGVLHKRNAAQLTRVKRQLKELQMRQKQLSDEASQLEDSISKLKD